MKFDYDVIIVGAGVAGALCAHKLSQHEGVKILMIDPGVNDTNNDQRMEFRKTFALAPTRASSLLAWGSSLMVSVFSSSETAKPPPPVEIRAAPPIQIPDPNASVNLQR